MMKTTPTKRYLRTCKEAKGLEVRHKQDLVMFYLISDKGHTQIKATFRGDKLSYDR